MVDFSAFPLRSLSPPSINPAVVRDNKKGDRGRTSKRPFLLKERFESFLEEGVLSPPVHTGPRVKMNEGLQESKQRKRNTFRHNRGRRERTRCLAFLKKDQLNESQGCINENIQLIESKEIIKNKGLFGMLMKAIPGQYLFRVSSTRPQGVGTPRGPSSSRPSIAPPPKKKERKGTKRGRESRKEKGKRTKKKKKITCRHRLHGCKKKEVSG